MPAPALRMPPPERLSTKRAPWVGPTRDTIGDEELVRRGLEGDAWALEALYRRHVRRVTRTAIRMLEDRSEGEDVAQDTFVEAFGRLKTLRDPQAFEGWLMRIAISKVHRRFRRRRLLRWLGRDVEPDLPLETLVSEDAAPSVRAEVRLLGGALADLPASARVAWMLRYVERHSLEEVAALTDCSLATAKRRIAEAQARIDRHVRNVR